MLVAQRTRPSGDALTAALEALKRGVLGEGCTEGTWRGYDCSLRRADREGLDVGAFLAGGVEARRAGDEWQHRRRSAGPSARRNDVRMLNALARACHARGWHRELVHWRQPRRPKPRRSALTPSDVDVVLASVADLPVRDQALVEVALLTGAGRTELSGMNVDDLDQVRSRVFIRGAKLHQSGWVPIEAELWRPDGPLLQYLDQRPMAMDGRSLWVSHRRPHRRLGPRGVYLALRQLQSLTGYTVHATATRHTRGRRLWKAGMPEALVQIFLRQSAESSTRIYTEPGPDDLMEWMQVHGGPGLRGNPGLQDACPTCRRPW